MRTPTFKELHVLLTLAALSAAATLFLLSQSACVSFDVGVAKVGLQCDRLRFANGGIEAEGKAYVYITPLQGIFALLNMDKEVLEAIEIMPPRAGVTEGKASE